MEDDDSVAIPMVERSSHESEGVPPYDKLRTPDADPRPHASVPEHHEPTLREQREQEERDAREAREQERARIQHANESNDDMMHGINSFWALIMPVCVTMIISCYVVVNYRNQNIEASMQTYLVFGQAEQQQGVARVGESFANALVIIGAIAVLTFGMALLYKFNCMKFLAGYIMFASTAILSFVGGQLVDSIINGQMHLVVDYPAFVYVMLNFGVVGVVSIFYQKGCPKMIQNGYLVLVSVILAWEFSMWPMWTTLIFCFMFACYDLCAVLSPCGPLKYLIGLIQEKQAPLPGLIYEADVRDGVGNEHAQAPPPPPQKHPIRSSSGTSSSSNSRHSHRRMRSPTRFVHSQPESPSEPPPSSSEAVPEPSQPHPEQSEFQNQTQPLVQPPHPQPQSEMQAAVPATTQALVNRPRNVAESDFTTHDCETMEELIALLEEFYRTFSPEDVWKAEQVADKFMGSQERLWILIFHKYMVCSCSMGMPCPVRARAARRRAQQEEEEDDKTIKLGLGDFIFYSVLVGRSGIYDFSTFVTSFLCIIVGLGGTLFLLSVLHKALPALPISIFLATIFYFWTQCLFIDFCNFVMDTPALV